VERFVPLTEQLAQQGTRVRLAADHTKVGKISHRQQRRIKSKSNWTTRWIELLQVRSLGGRILRQ
jgi:hypothetical protein